MTYARDPITSSARYLGSITILRRWLDPYGYTQQPSIIVAKTIDSKLSFQFRLCDLNKSSQCLMIKS